MSTVHKHAFLTNFELACVFSIVALVCDFLWVVHDINANGLSFIYCVIATGLFISTCGTIWVLIRHHLHYTHKYSNKVSQ